MRLEQLLWRRFTAATPDGPLGRRTMRTPSTQDIIAAMEARYGTRIAASRAAGIGYSTWRHLRAGRTPSVATGRRLTASWRGLLMRHADAFATWPGIVWYGLVSISNDNRVRALNVGRWNDDAARRRFDAVQADVVDAWLAGDDQRAVELFATPVMAGLSFNAREHRFVLDSYDLRFFPTQGAADTWVRAHPTIHPK